MNVQEYNAWVTTGRHVSLPCVTPDWCHRNGKCIREVVGLEREEDLGRGEAPHCFLSLEDAIRTYRYQAAT
jgi:hypothetical protein